jgi:AraC family transcriptional regulator of adaptative response/methylated-DNA-[protein]-cysteine methyltransferase
LSHADYKILATNMKELLQQSNIGYGFSDTPFGRCCIGFTDQGIFSVTFPESTGEGFDEIVRRYGCKAIIRDDEQSETWAKQIFSDGIVPPFQLIGTPFQISIWNELLEIKLGSCSTYQQIADAIGRPKAVRAVGTAIGANPIAFLVPCHRIIRSDGTLGGYKWGVERKKQILLWEKTLKKE